MSPLVDATSTSDTPHPTERPLIVGRDHERETLVARLERARADQGGVVLVSGEAGIGKTTLVNAVREAAEDYGALVLAGGCYDLTVTPPYGPWREILRAYPASGDLPTRPPALVDADALARLPSQLALFEEAHAFFAAVAAIQPLVLVLEDLHWSDAPSLEALRFIARGISDKRILIVATFRDDELLPDHPLYQHRLPLVRETGAVRIELHRLSAHALTELTDARYHLTGPDSERLATWLRHRSEGNPFYALELLRGLEASGSLISTPDGLSWHLEMADDIKLPPLVRQAIDLRLRRLDDDARRNIQLAAVIGEEVSFDLWFAVCGCSSEALVASYEQAAALQIVVESRHGTAFRFTHALVREVLYESISALRRRQWHRSVAEELLANPGSDPDVIAYHFQQAGDERQFDWLVRAGERARRAFAWSLSSARYEAALATLEHDPSRQLQRGWLLFRLGANHRGDDVPRALQYFEQARAVADTVDDPVLLAFTTYAHGQALINAGDPRLGLPLFETGIAALATMPIGDRRRLNATFGVFTPEAWPDFDALGTSPATTPEDHEPKPADSFGDIRRQGVLAYFLATNGQALRALQLADNALQRLEGASTTDITFLGPTYHGRGHALALLGMSAESDDAYVTALHIYESGQMHYWGLQCLEEMVDNVAHIYRSPATTRREARLALAERFSRRVAEIYPDGFDYRAVLVHEYLLHGNWGELDALLDEIDHTDRHGALQLRIRGVGAEIARYRNQPDVAWKQIMEALPLGAETEPGDQLYLVAIRLQQQAIALLVDAGDGAIARRWLENHDRWVAWSGAQVGRVEGTLGWARYWWVAGDPVQSLQLAQTALDLANDPERSIPLLQAHHLLGALAIDAGRLEDAFHHLHLARNLAVACAVPILGADVEVDLAMHAMATGMPSQSREYLESARSVCEPVSARRVLQRIDHLVEQLPPQAGSAALPGGLTSREVEVLRLVARGMSDAEAAEQLFISTRTVSQHLRSIYAKLGVSSRTAAARFAIDAGIV